MPWMKATHPHVGAGNSSGRTRSQSHSPEVLTAYEGACRQLPPQAVGSPAPDQGNPQKPEANTMDGQSTGPAPGIIATLDVGWLLSLT